MSDSDPNSMTDLLAELQEAMDRARGRKRADDQRAAEERVLELCDMDYERAAATVAEFDRLRAELAETRPRCTCDYSGLESEPHKTWCELEGGPHAECAARHDVMERELAETRAAGDALCDAAVDLSTAYAGTHPVREKWTRLRELIDAWRSVRGDAPAPAVPPAAPGPRAWSRLPGEIPAGSEQWRDGWATGYEQAGIDASVVDHVRGDAPAGSSEATEDQS